MTALLISAYLAYPTTWPPLSPGIDFLAKKVVQRQAEFDTAEAEMDDMLRIGEQLWEMQPTHGLAWWWNALHDHNRRDDRQLVQKMLIARQRLADSKQLLVDIAVAQSKVESRPGSGRYAVVDKDLIPRLMQRVIRFRGEHETARRSLNAYELANNYLLGDPFTREEWYWWPLYSGVKAELEYLDRLVEDTRSKYDSAARVVGEELLFLYENRR